MEMNNILYLDIPILPAELEKEIIQFGDQLIATVDPWVENFYQHKIRVAAHHYGKPDTFLNQDIMDKLKKIYGPYFGNDFVAFIGKLENTYKTGLVENPPHCDKFRYISINYLLGLGGNNVLTCFYNESRKSKLMDKGENAKHEDLTLNYKIRLPKSTWHSFNVQCFHSVENIETSRLILSLVLLDNPDFNTFKEKYKNIIK